MSITHRLQFESQRTGAEVLESLLSSNIGLQQAKYGEVQAEGLFGRVTELSRNFQTDFLEEYGFKPNLMLSFDEDSDGDVEIGEVVMGKAVAFILQQEKGNAMFFYVVDTPILKRLSGKTTVANRHHFVWLRNALDEVGLTYELKPVEEIESV